jgi:hypothetical protein
MEMNNTRRQGKVMRSSCGLVGVCCLHGGAGSETAELYDAMEVLEERGKQKGDIYRWWGWRIALCFKREALRVTRTMNTRTKKALQSENRKHTWGKGVLEVLVCGCRSSERSSTSVELLGGVEESLKVLSVHLCARRLFLSPSSTHSHTLAAVISLSLLQDAAQKAATSNKYDPWTL